MGLPQRHCSDAFCRQPSDGNHDPTALSVRRRSSLKRVQIRPIHHYGNRNRNDHLIRRGHRRHNIYCKNESLTVPNPFRAPLSRRSFSTKNWSPGGNCSLSGLLLTNWAFTTSPVETSRSTCPLDDSSRPSQRALCHLVFHFLPDGTFGFSCPHPLNKDTWDVSTLGSDKSGIWEATKTRVEPPRTLQVSSPQIPIQLCSQNSVESHEVVRAAFGRTSQCIHSTRYHRQA